MLRHQQLLTKKEVAEMLKTSTSTIDRWVRIGRLPIIKLGDSQQGSVRFNKLDVILFIEGVTPDVSTLQSQVEERRIKQADYKGKATERELLSIRVTAEQKQELIERALKKHKNISQYARGILFN